MNRATINHFKVAMLFAVPSALFGAMSYAVAGWAWLMLSAGAYSLLAGIAFFCARRMILKQHGAEYMPNSQAPGLYALLSELAERAEISTPALYLLPEAAPQLLITAGNSGRGAIALSNGLLRLLNTRELAAVIAHAIDHLRSREAGPMTLVAGLVGGLISISKFFRWSNLLGARYVSTQNFGGVPSDAFLWFLFAPIAAVLVRSTVYPSRKFRADAASAHLIGDSNPLSTALRKIEAHTPKIAAESVSPATAHLFLCSPISEDSAMHLFRTHPPITERLERLDALGHSIRYFQRVMQPSRRQKSNTLRERQINI
jgi:heat shock protein HtpX